MTDRFKLRYNYNNKIYDVSAIDFTRSRGEIVSLDKKETLMCKLDLNNLIQCTGLKDKNSKLIYEGDIIKYMYYNPERYTKWVVVFNQNTLEFGLKDYGYDGYSRLTSYSIINNKVEVIGNIYENPELLKENE